MQQTTLYQLRTESSVISGMSYVVKCGDGSIFVIDGGYDHGDAEILLTFLKGLTQSDHPVVDAWLITHGHPDHTGALHGVAKRHYKEITVKKLIYRWPEEDFIKASQPVVLRQLEVLERDLVNLNAEHVVPSVGDVYRFGDTEFEVLLTCDRLDPIKPGDHRDFNDSSTVVKLRANGQTVLFLGDVAAAGDRVMIDMHGKNLKSDVCQLAHHGFASTAEFYDYVDPEILLWPVDEKRVPVQMRYNGVNRHLVCEMKVKRIFLSDRGTVCLPLPVSVEGESYMPPLVPHVKSDEPLFDIPRAPEGFNWSDAFDGGWDGAGKVALKPDKPDKVKTPASAEAGLFWDDGYLYIRTVFKKEVIPSDPLHRGTTDSTNVRLYFYEAPVTDCYLEWGALRGETGLIEKLLLYPEIKEGLDTYTDSPGLCDAACVPVDGGFCVTARIRLEREHRTGDTVSINIKASANDVPGGSRTSSLSMLEPEPAKYIHIRPACMVLARLA